MILVTIMLFAVSIIAGQDIDYHETLCDHCDQSELPIEELQEIMNCVIDKGPCNEVNASYKQHFPHVVQEACARCNVVQKRSARIFFDRVRKELPQDFEYFLNLYDPERKYFDAFYNALKDF